MKQAYLIDGYNLIHALGLLPKKVGPGGLEKARRGLLGLLHGSLSHVEHPPHVTVVFDAANAPPGSTSAQDHLGIKVLFALGGLQADDVIESLIQHEPVPKQLTVVSNDHRLHQAARRRHAHVLSCEDFLDVLAKARPRNPQPAPLPPEKAPPTAEETKHWLEQFGDLDNELGDINFKF